MLNSRFLGGQVDTIIGSYHSNYDLERCRAREAQACFIIADKSKKNPDVEDANVILGGKFYKKNKKISYLRGLFFWVCFMKGLYVYIYCDDDKFIFRINNSVLRLRG